MIVSRHARLWIETTNGTGVSQPKGVSRHARLWIETAMRSPAAGAGLSQPPRAAVD